VLEELAISLKHNLVSKLPFCAFNGGNDVFVDVGNKSLGLDALMRYLDAYPYEVRGRLALWLWRCWVPECVCGS
jgi:IMP and pyridine-specific 5'-nucleotidase